MAAAAVIDEHAPGEAGRPDHALADVANIDQDKNGVQPGNGDANHAVAATPVAEKSLQSEQEEKAAVVEPTTQETKPLVFTQIAMHPKIKKLGASSPHLNVKDFELVKTLGTGTFARVWLAKFLDPSPGEEGKVYALKILRKVDVVRLKQIEHVRNERNVLAAVSGHPFITTLITSFSDKKCLYMLLDYCPGGEVFSYLRRARRFNEPTSRFYAAEIVLILEYLHDVEGVAYRDLKPENILIDSEGHLKLVDFGFAKKVDNLETYTLCGTPEYLAPEVILNTGHSLAVDWWALGILIYEFIVGQPPFWDNNPLKIYEKIVKGKIHFPPGISAETRSMIMSLCTVNPSERLGNISGGSERVKSHPFFEGVDWDDVYHRKMKGPIIPKLKSCDDTSCFDEYEDPKQSDSDEEAECSRDYSRELAEAYEDYWKDF